jgi:hypothetical protein
MNIVNGCMTALTQFPPEGTSAQSDECYRLIREGIVNAYPYHPGRREPTMRELGAQIGRMIIAARLRAALPPRQTTYAERVAIARELRRGQ